MALWFRRRVAAPSFPSIPGVRFAAVYAEIEQTLKALPLFQLLSWKWRIQVAYLPSDVVVPIPKAALKHREVIPDWLRDLPSFLQTVVTPVLTPAPSRPVPVL